MSDRPTPDAQHTTTGYSVTQPARETFLFPAEVGLCASQASPGQVLRVLDAFVFLVDGKKKALTGDWYSTQDWDRVVVIGAIASLAGEDTLWAQSGRFDKIDWRWLLLRPVTLVKIRSDARFRKGLTEDMRPTGQKASVACLLLPACRTHGDVIPMGRSLPGGIPVKQPFGSGKNSASPRRVTSAVRRVPSQRKMRLPV
ncbi:hypothetical protein FRC06_004103 [Ceratobasidium sp. 370]|nr:hypothetical protein FRC06_004103 [Ceratobasidium sp. 370]